MEKVQLLCGGVTPVCGYTGIQPFPLPWMVLCNFGLPFSFYCVLLSIVHSYFILSNIHLISYTIERAYARAYTCICACTCIHVSLCLFACINANAVSYVRLRACVRAFACVHLRACLREELIKTQNAFARKIFQRAKYFNTQTHFGFRNFQDVLYIQGNT